MVGMRMKRRPAPDRFARQGSLSEFPSSHDFHVVFGDSDEANRESLEPSGSGGLSVRLQFFCLC